MGFEPVKIAPQPRDSRAVPLRAFRAAPPPSERLDETTAFRCSAAVPIAGIVSVVFFRGDRNGEQNEDSPEVITQKGAVQFGEEHAFTRTIREFEKRVKAYYGKPVKFELYVNSELGLEKDYFAYMSQGISVDYGIVSPAHMSTFSESAPLMDMPFLFRDLDHWNKVLDGDGQLSLEQIPQASNP